MDELFGVADFSGVDDLGTTMKHIEAGDVESTQHEYTEERKHC